jgi:hypothetical protein
VNILCGCWAPVASEIRRLLSARQLLETDLARVWKRGMSYQQFQQTVLKQGTALLTHNPYGDYVCFQRAERFSLADLSSYMEGLVRRRFAPEVERLASRDW